MSDQDSIRRKRHRPSDDDLLAAMKIRFSYDVDKGCFVWKQPLRNMLKKQGDVVGGQGSQRYSSVFLLGHRFKVHRLIWLWHHGTYPVGDIDHINGDQHDNRIANLRIATSAQNAMNRLRKNKYGTGVGIAIDGKFTARITHPITKKRIYLGRYSTKEESAAAYVGAAAVLHGEFAIAVSRKKPCT